MDISAANDYISPANTAYVLICALLVFFMIPGLGFFYAGLDRKKYVLTMIMQSLVSIPITAIIWIFWGFGLAFGPNVNDSLAGGLIGDPAAAGTAGLVSGSYQGNIAEHWLLWKIAFTSDGSLTIWNGGSAAGNGIPTIVFFIYQLMFAAITPALMTGAFADRMTWGKYIIFNILWQYLIYIPICHWIWGGGFLASIGVLDWAGGIVIHTTAGFGAIAAVLLLGRRKGLGGHPKPMSPVLVMLGIAFLWFGWFGFNSGGGMGIVSASHTVDADTINGFINTALAPCFAMLTWMILEWFTHHRKMSAVSVAGAFVAGLAGITPDAGYIPIYYGFLVGVLVAIIGFFTLMIMQRSKKIDDAMDVFSVHGVTGFFGAVFIGAFMPFNNLSTYSVIGNGFLSSKNASSYDLGNISGDKSLQNSLQLGHDSGIWQCYQVAAELGAAALAAGWAFVVTIIILGFILGTSKIIPGTHKMYVPSFEEEIENIDPIDTTVLSSDLNNLLPNQVQKTETNSVANKILPSNSTLKDDDLDKINKIKQVYITD